MFDNSSKSEASSPTMIGATSHNNGIKVIQGDPLDGLIYGNYRRFAEAPSLTLDPSISYPQCVQPMLKANGVWVAEPKITRATTPYVQYPFPRRVSCSWAEENESLGLLRPYDVICGRSRLAHSYMGNQNLRRLIREHSPRYQGTSCRQEKKRITITIISHIQKRGGRFLTVDSEDDAASVTSFEIISPQNRYMKVSHALRSHHKAPSSKKVQERKTEIAACVSAYTPDEDRPASVVSWQEDEDFEAESDSERRPTSYGADCDGDPLLAKPIKEVEEPIWDDSELDMGEIDVQLLFRL